VLPNGDISNQIRLKIANRAPEERSYLIELVAGDGIALVAPENPLTVAAGDTEMTGAFITAPPAAFAAGEVSITLQISDGVDFSRDIAYRILGPASDGGGAS
jgi:hypothetical protein